MDEGILGCLTSIIVVLAIIFCAAGMMAGLNSCSSHDWNGGTCFNCEIRYELKGVSDGLKYYACPECGLEVQKY